MTTELKQAAAALFDFQCGKTIEIKHPDEEWRACRCIDVGAILDCIQNGALIRPTVIRPWSKPEDVPGPVCWIRADSRFYGAMIVGIDEHGVWTAGGDENIRHTWAAFNTPTEYSTDMKTWSPCVVAQQEAQL
jgi:hypothetical protein